MRSPHVSEADESSECDVHILMYMYVWVVKCDYAMRSCCWCKCSVCWVVLIQREAVSDQGQDRGRYVLRAGVGQKYGPAVTSSLSFARVLESSLFFFQRSVSFEPLKARHDKGNLGLVVTSIVREKKKKWKLATVKANLKICLLRSLLDYPLLALLLGFLAFGILRGGVRRTGHENAWAGHLAGVGTLAGVLGAGRTDVDVRAAGGRECRLRSVLAELAGALLALEVAAAPDAGADPDTGDANNQDDDGNDPLPVIRDPEKNHVSKKNKRTNRRRRDELVETYQSPPGPSLAALLDDPVDCAPLASSSDEVASTTSSSPPPPPPPVAEEQKLVYHDWMLLRSASAQLASTQMPLVFPSWKGSRG